MKYNAQVKNKYAEVFAVESMDDYSPNKKDVLDFTEVLSDSAVRKYITDEALSKYKINSVNNLASGILENSAEKWKLREELRFLIRYSKEKTIVGMIGIDLKTQISGEMWFYKISSTTSFMYEAINEILSFLKNEDIEEVTTTFEEANTRSIDLLKRLGFANSSNVNEMVIFL